MNTPQSTRRQNNVIKYIYSGQQITDIPKDITHLEVHPSVNDIPASAFEDCTSLVEVQCHEGLRTIGRDAFQKCTALRSISISSTVLRIESRAFAYCESLSEMGLPEGLVSIGEQTFYACKSMIKVSIPSTAEWIGEHAFDACIRLFEIKFHNGIEKKPTSFTIGRGIFHRCDSLVHVQFSEGLNVIPADAFTMCESLRTLSVPKSVAKIGDSAFDGCISLVEVLFQEGLRVIDENAFAQCIALRIVSFPKSLVSIEGGAFLGCDCLVDVEFAEGLESIGEEAFFECESLSAVALPRSLKRIDADAFSDCTSLLGVEFPNGINPKVFPGGFFECSNLVNVSIPASMELSMDDDVFRGCKFFRDEDGVLDEITNRFSQLPVHETCYNASITTVDELRSTLDSCNTQEDIIDVYGMTPFHVVATSAKLRSDFMEILLDRYPVEILACKDRHRRTMMDYLLMHQSTKAIPLIKVVIRHFLAGWTEDTQRNELFMIVDSICGEGNTKTRRDSFHEISKLFTSYMQLEITTIAEMALWKHKIARMEQEEPTGKADRAFCRYNCGADVVIRNVVSFVWDNQSASCFAGLLPIGPSE